ncbi:hypothetical protein CWE04_03565 [Thomasclavelia cocleata]|uniref:glycoside hydrolase family 2 TIM barrel-domain containing protein n=1 Tax=Thomasclavelia cocleata TaxID=69824 RepID=UPI000C276916|nr:glycoside hydrolase family 2 TIM barrel-domain containing protein [Thomasclavelia cocleata]PJN81276.1 hypothetical protein CWE04_03565 [Thomasclavelia cocleata]
MKKLFSILLTMMMAFSAITPLSVQGMEFESTVISDLSIQGLRDIGNLEVGTKTHVFVTTYPEEGVELLVESEDSSIANVSLDEKTIVVQAKKVGTTTVEVIARKGDKIESGQFIVQVIESVYKQSSHIEVNINENDWRFRLEKDMEKVPASQTVPNVSDNWEHVQVPHCWNSKDGADGNNDYVKGKGWYISNVDFTVDTYENKNIYLEVQGACKITDVYIDGNYVGQHEGGYSNFRFDITDYVKKDGLTQIALCVDNRVNSLMPLSGDFTVFGGLYRDVNIIAVDDSHFDLLDHGSEGVLINQAVIDNVTKDSTVEEVFSNGGKINIDARVAVNNGEKAYMQTVVYDANWSEVTSSEKIEINGTGVIQNINEQVIVNDPHLWNGVADPYLYNVKVFLYDESNNLKDIVYKKIGFRFYYVDENEGFFLNGKSYPLRGVNKHQDRMDKGYAVSKKDQEEDMAMIANIGANALRLAHYQHDEYAYELADIYGICAWAEIPLVNSMTASTHFTESTKNNLEELIKQNISHPSIIVWGIHNEQWPNNGGRINTLLRDLYELSHELDNSRLVTVATAQSQSAALSWQSDVSAWNKYFGLYESQDVRYFGTWLDQVKEYAQSHDSINVTDESTGETIKVNVNGKIGMSEYGVGSNIEYHEENPGYRVGTGFDAYQSEEFQSQWHEIYYKAIEERPWLWGTFVWNMFEFGSDSRSEAGRKGINNKGMVAYDRTLKKDVFYFYKATWSKDPTLHITSKRFENRFQDVISTKVYANMDEVELFVNGISQGVKTAKEVEQHKFMWDITLQSGENHVVAIGKKDGKTYVDETTWNRKLHDTVSISSNLYNFTYVNDENSTVSGIPAGTKVQDFKGNVKLSNGTSIEVYNSDKSTLLDDNTSISYDMWIKAISEDKEHFVWYRVIVQPISRNKPVIVENEKSGEPKENMVDGKTSTTWNSGVALSAQSPQNAIIDLQDLYYVYDTNVLWWDHDTSHRTFTYSIYLSQDNVNWVKVIDQTKSNDQSSGMSWTNRSFAPQLARYVKIEGLSATNSVASMYIREVEVHGFMLKSDVYRVDNANAKIKGWTDATVEDLLNNLIVEGNFDKISVIDQDGSIVNGGKLNANMKVLISMGDEDICYTLERSGLDATPISQNKKVIAFEGIDSDGVSKPNEDVLEGENDLVHGKNYAPAHYINDGKLDTRWSGAMNAAHDKAIYPAKVCFDLGARYNLNHLDLTFFGGTTPHDENKVNRYYTYKIYASDTLDVLQQEIVDEKYLIVDGSDNIDKKENHVIKDLSAKGRYVLLVVDGKNTSYAYHAPSVWEMEVEGYQMSSPLYDIDENNYIVSGVNVGTTVEEFLNQLEIDGNAKISIVDGNDKLDSQDLIYEGVTLVVESLNQGTKDSYTLSFVDSSTAPISQNKPVQALATEEEVDGKIVANEDVSKGFVATNINDGDVNTRWSGVMNAARTQSYYPATVHLDLTEKADTNDWFYLTGVTIDWFNSASKRSYQYELHALNPVGIAGGYDLVNNDNTVQDYTEHWVDGKTAQIKDMSLTVNSSSLNQSYIPAVAKEIKVYGWRLSGSIVDESSATVKLDDNSINVAKLIAMLQPKGNCVVEIQDDKGNIKNNNDLINQNDKVVIKDIRDQKFIYAIKLSNSLDLSLLEKLLTTCNQLQESDYTSVSWAEFKTAMDNAKEVLEKADATQEEVDNAVIVLQNAKEALVKAEVTVNKTKLQIAVDLASNVTEEDLDKVVPAVVEEFNAALAEANTILANDNATQEEVDTSFARLSVAMHMLEFLKGDKTELQDLVDSTADLVAGNYTPESWSALQEALVEANAVLDDVNAMQEEVDDTCSNLQAAIDGLVEVKQVDKSLLEAMVNRVLGLEEDKYVPATWQAMLPKLEAAQEVLADDNATRAEVDKAWNDLTRAYLNLRLKPIIVQKGELQDLVDSTADLVEENYTEESWTALQDALDKANAVLTNDNATQEEVDEAYDNLQAAIDGLIEVKTSR